MTSNVHILRGYWSLELLILDVNLANQSSKDIIQISEFEELASGLRNIFAKFFCMHTLPDTQARQGDLSQNGKSISSQILFVLYSF
jgi:hypothetical protein